MASNTNSSKAVCALGLVAISFAVVIVAAVVLL